jgi:hypothetical protein
VQREILRDVIVKDANFFANGGREGEFEERKMAMLTFLEAIIRGPEVSDKL